uniref:Tyrosine-protein kinase n=1 Tax=Amphimedon queenslandica TaxID=400682 RepID=A0A1X7TYE1_AMPQE
MHSLHTNKRGYVLSNGILPLNEKYSPMYYKCVYYHIVSRYEAEKRLSQADTQAGTFLIRDSDSNLGQHYILSVNDGVTIRHYHISIDINKYYILPHVKFYSLNELVHHYMMKEDYLTCSITIPLPKQVNTPNAKEEINKSQIKFLKCINVGQFGETWEGCWNSIPSYKLAVIIKTNVATNIIQETFLEEANTLRKIHHKTSFVYMLMNYGNLKTYVTRYNVRPKELLYITIQVAYGMIYLGEHDYIHCDLQATKILVGECNTIKIANFHLAQHLSGNKYWTVEEGSKLAIRWTAPEWHTLNQLSIKSDVWSFGILLWELVTKGALPYHGMMKSQVVEAISKGYHMPIGSYCPEPFQQLMINCWKYNDDERPDFEDIFDVFFIYRAFM